MNNNQKQSSSQTPSPRTMSVHLATGLCLEQIASEQEKSGHTDASLSLYISSIEHLFQATNGMLPNFCLSL